MPYITEDYYQNTFKGLMPVVSTDLTILIERASDVIDIVTNFKITKDLSEYDLFTKKQVEKATAVQVLFFIVNGGYEEMFVGSANNKSEKIGSFGYTKGDNSKSEFIAPTSIDYLSTTGLLYAGLEVNYL